MQIHLIPDDAVGEDILSIVNTRRDTLGSVQRLCRYVYCMNDFDRAALLSKIRSGEIKSVAQGIKEAEGRRAEKVRER